MGMEKSEMMKLTETSTKLVMPQDLNPHGNLFGGVMMAWMDKITAILAMRVTGMNCVTVKVDEINFHNPVRLQDVVTLKAKVSKIGNSSITIAVEALSRHVTSERTHQVATSKFVFVAVNDYNMPCTVWPNRA